MSDLAEELDAAAGPLRRMTAITAQIKLAAVPADAACCCLCSIYEPHACDGWRVKDLTRQVPGGTLFGKQLPPVEVPVCKGCCGAPVRKS